MKKEKIRSVAYSDVMSGKELFPNPEKMDPKILAPLKGKVMPIYPEVSVRRDAKEKDM